MAKAELDSLFGLLPFRTSISWLGRLAEVVCQRSPLDFILSRGALVREAGVLVASADVPWTLVDSLSEGVLQQHLSSERSFAVRSIVVDNEMDYDERADLERQIGGRIQKMTGLKVELCQPDVLFRVYLHTKRSLLCQTFESQLRPMLRAREPGRKLFFHPSMMNAVLARVMCNLAGVMPNDIVLDPFCGGGGILCEAAHIGAKLVGIDLVWRMLTGARTNLSEITSSYTLVQGDACSSSVREGDCLVTDPPYGMASSTRGTKTIDLMQRFVQQIETLVSGPGENVCICSSERMGLPEIVRDYGLSVGKCVKIRVHGRLVRELLTVVL